MRVLIIFIKFKKNLTRELFNSFSNFHYNAFLSLKDNLYYGETE